MENSDNKTSPITQGMFPGMSLTERLLVFYRRVLIAVRDELLRRQQQGAASTRQPQASDGQNNRPEL